MTTSTMSLFFALLAAIAQAGVAAALLLWWLGRRPGPARRLRDAALREVGGAALWIAWGVAAIATAGSLYYSEIAGFTPCELCWYQRIAMYPLVVILGIAAWRNDRSVARAALPLAAIGGAISSYHSLIQRFPELTGGTSCDPAAPCTAILVWQLGYLSIPLMALSGFGLIATLVLVATRRRAPTEEVTRDAVEAQAARA
jgi:disulfide bond formation protein DsbB